MTTQFRQDRPAKARNRCIEALAKTLWDIDIERPWSSATDRFREMFRREARDITYARTCVHPRRIETRSQLDKILQSTEGLHGAVVRDLHGNIYEATDDPGIVRKQKVWVEIGSAGPYCLSGRIALPARLLWHPDWPGVPDY
ncbi:hypothetical protein CCUG60884_00184 [Mycobacteroides salmoniphilum]|uniref:Uncharacterized protein n=1 Tax=Mycobacteroides salmoniphilum TaxID=404941 RepID=A0A4V3I1F8_9MYCO|nr:hypothetical protein CCUG60884_00184 [Mycobacteroides salmoniphilum]